MIKPVYFTNMGITLVANLYRPENFDETQRYQAIVVVHPSGGSKEQTSGLYAEKLAKEGFVTLAYDATCQGESGGEPRQLENPYLRVEDISAAVDYLTTLKFVDEERIGVLGICAGGGYAVNATMMDRRIKAVGGVSLVNYGDMYRLGWTGDALPSSSIAFLDQAALQRGAEAKGAPVGYLPTAPLSLEDAPNDDLAEGYLYYRTPRAMHANAPSKFTTRSLAQLVTYDAFNHADVFLTQPMMVFAGSKAGSRWHTENIYQRAASISKSMHIIDGATHLSLYDNPQQVAEVTGKLKLFYAEFL